MSGGVCLLLGTLAGVQLLAFTWHLLQEARYPQTSDQRARATCLAAIGPKITWALLDLLFKQNAHTEGYPATLT